MSIITHVISRTYSWVPTGGGVGKSRQSFPPLENTKIFYVGGLFLYVGAFFSLWGLFSPCGRLFSLYKGLFLLYGGLYLLMGAFLDCPPCKKFCERPWAYLFYLVMFQVSLWLIQSISFYSGAERW